jgi:hypothetical protein
MSGRQATLEECNRRLRESWGVAAPLPGESSALPPLDPAVERARPADGVLKTGISVPLGAVETVPPRAAKRPKTNTPKVTDGPADASAPASDRKARGKG